MRLVPSQTTERRASRQKSGEEPGFLRQLWPPGLQARGLLNFGVANSKVAAVAMLGGSLGVIVAWLLGEWTMAHQSEFVSIGSALVSSIYVLSRHQFATAECQKTEALLGDLRAMFSNGAITRAEYRRLRKACVDDLGRSSRR